MEKLRTRVEQLDTTVTDNIHYRILKEQKEKADDELAYLRNRVRNMETQARAAEVEHSLLSDSRTRDADNEAARLRIRLRDSEQRRLGADAALAGVLPVIEQSGGVASLPAGVQLDVELWKVDVDPIREQSTFPAALRAGAAASPAAASAQAMGRRRLDPIAQPSGPSPASSPQRTAATAQTAAENVNVGREAPKDGRSPAALRGMVDSAQYFATQRGKAVPSIYDLDW